MYSLVSSGAIESVRISSSPSARPRREPERMLLLGAMAVNKVGHTAKKCRGGAARHPLGVPPKPTLKGTICHVAGSRIVRCPVPKPNFS
jgi:hypothetical protein